MHWLIPVTSNIQAISPTAQEVQQEHCGASIKHKTIFNVSITAELH